MKSCCSSLKNVFDKYFAILIIGILVVLLGVWNVGIPLGDEGIHALQGLNLAGNKTFSMNLYYSIYALLFRTVTDDPVVAHVIIRFVVTVATTLGMYFVITAFKSISRLAAVVACLIWASSTYANPYVQIGNINGFAFVFAVLGLGMLLRYPTINSLLLFIIGAFWAANVRPEYYASLLAVSLCGVALLMVAKKKCSFISTLVISSLLIASVWSSVTAKVERGSLNEYLLQGLGQCYAVYYLKNNPSEIFDPMTEYQPILDKTFGNPKNFFEAVANNPAEAFKYLAINGVKNTLRIIPAMTASNYIAKSVLTKILVVIGTIVGIRAIFLRYKNRQPASNSSLQDKLKILILLAFASASSAAIILLIPDPRYWISCAPLVYLWFAWAIDNFLSIKWVALHKRNIVLAILLFLSIPHLIVGKPKRVSNQQMIYAMREAAKQLPAPVPAKPVIAGNFVAPVASFVFRGEATPINTYNGLSVEDLKKHKYDIFVATELENTSLWQSELAFLKNFREEPEKFGYRRLIGSDGEMYDIYVRK